MLNGATIKVELVEVVDGLVEVEVILGIEVDFTEVVKCGCGLHFNRSSLLSCCWSLSFWCDFCCGLFYSSFKEIKY